MPNEPLCLILRYSTSLETHFVGSWKLSVVSCGNQRHSGKQSNFDTEALRRATATETQYKCAKWWIIPSWNTLPIISSWNEVWLWTIVVNRKPIAWNCNLAVSGSMQFSSLFLKYKKRKEFIGRSSPLAFAYFPTHFFRLFISAEESSPLISYVIIFLLS